MTLHELTAPLRRGLSQLRARVRSLLLTLGLARVFVFCAAALTVFFFADYLLRLPLGVRRFSLFVFAAGLVVVVVRHLVRPLTHHLHDELLAERVEAARPELENRLSSSLSFVHAADNPDNSDSPDLMRAVVQETVDMASTIPFRAVARSRTTVRWVVVAATLLGAVLVGLLAQPRLVSIFAQRSLLLRDISWPRRTTLRVLNMVPDKARQVTRGREVTIEVEANGSLPDRVTFSFWESEGEPRVETIELTPASESPERFAITLPVYTSFEFSVTGGDDDRARVYSVDALTPPTIVGIFVDATYPAYLELEPETLRGGDQRLPEGTTARLRFKTNMPLQLATIAFGGEEPRELEPTGEDLFATTLEAKQDLRYSVRLVGNNGEENDPGVDTFVIRVHKDSAPVVRIHTPGARSERLARGVVLVRFGVRDDHRVAAARVVYRVNDGKERVTALGESGGDVLRILGPAERAPGFLLGLAAFDLGRMRTDEDKPLSKGDVLSYHVNATDSAGHVQRTRATHKVELVTEEDLGQILEARQQELRESVDRAREHLGKASADLDAVRDLDAANQNEFRRGTGHAQAAQARVITDLDSLSRRLRGVLNLYVFNRLGDASAVDQILPYYERHLLEQTDQTGLPFRSSLYRGLWAAHQERAIRAGGPLTKLIEMSDLAARLAVDHAPQAYRALAAIRAKQDADAIRTSLDEASAEQTALSEGLERLARLMREWQSYEGVVRFFKSLREHEKGLVEELEGLDPPGK